MDKHQDPRDKATLGSVKAEKISHITEGHLGIDLGRHPERLAAGPADFPHLQKVAHRAKMKFAFHFSDRNNSLGHEFVPLGGYAKALRRSEDVLASRLNEIDALISLFVPMKTNDAEAVATLYAVWNDFLAHGQAPSDEDIVLDFYQWSSDKIKKFDKSGLLATLRWMRDHALVPTGDGKPTKRRVT
jgi:hypothetical protein